MRSEYDANQHLQSRVRTRQSSQAWMQPAKHAAKRRAAKHRRRYLLELAGPAMLLMTLTVLVGGWLAMH